jgi:hypothetical protein
MLRESQEMRKMQRNELRNSAGEEQQQQLRRDRKMHVPDQEIRTEEPTAGTISYLTYRHNNTGFQTSLS